MSNRTVRKQLNMVATAYAMTDPNWSEADSNKFFDILVKKMYRTNTARRDWARTTLQEFYEEELERWEILELSGVTLRRKKII